MQSTKYKEYIDQITEENIEQQKAFALAQHLQIEPAEDETLDDYLAQIVSTDHTPELFEADGGEYLVLTDDEAEEKWNEALDNYIDECIFPELPESFRFYFDYEKWKSDAKMDGRGHSLSSYDGEEHEERINGIDFYIYRVN